MFHIVSLCLLVLTPLASLAIVDTDLDAQVDLYARQNLPAFQHAVAAKEKLLKALSTPVYCTELTERKNCGFPKGVCNRPLNICVPLAVDTYFAFQRVPESDASCSIFYSAVKNDGDLKNQLPLKCVFTGPQSCATEKDCPTSQQQQCSVAKPLDNIKRCWTSCKSDADCKSISGTQCREGVCYV